MKDKTNKYKTDIQKYKSNLYMLFFNSDEQKHDYHIYSICLQVIYRRTYKINI